MDLQDIDKKLDTVAENIDAIQAKHAEFGDKVFGDEGFEKQISKVLSDVEEIQTARQSEAGEKAALEATVEELKKRIARGIQGGDSDLVDDFKEYGDEFVRYLKKGHAIDAEKNEEMVRGMIERNFKGASAEEIAVEVKDLTAGNNPQGGYFIRPEVSARMIKRIFESSPMRSVATVETIASDSLEMIIDDNEAGSGGWVGEVDPRDISGTPDVGKLIIEAHEIFAQPRATQKMLDDAGFDIESWLQRKVTNKLSRDENTAFVAGDGALKPKGLLSYPDAASPTVYERGAIRTLTATGTAGALDNADDLLLLQNSIPEEYQANAVFGMRRATFGSVITLKDNQDQYLFQSRLISEMREMVLLGKPVVFMDDLESVGTGNLPVIYGDFSEGYTIVDRTGFRVIRDEVTNKPFVLFYTSKRTGGDVTSYDSWSRLRIN